MRENLTMEWEKKRTNSGKANAYSVLHLQNTNFVDSPVLISNIKRDAMNFLK